jgi:hypothetical protein
MYRKGDKIYFSVQDFRLVLRVVEIWGMLATIQFTILLVFSFAVNSQKQKLKYTEL